MARHTSFEIWPEEGSPSARPNFVEPAGSVVERLATELPELLGANLVGLYVYGSLAFGCYNPKRSDVDVLVVTRRRMARETRPALSAFLNTFSILEISFLSRADLDPWRHPCPYDYHYSHSTEKEDGENVDLAAEVANARTRSVTLLGPPAEEVFPQVPDEDYLDTLVQDIRWARARGDIPVYMVLNCCRALAFERTRQLMSKAEGGEWGMHELPPEFRSLAEEALAAYASEAAVGDDLDTEEVLRFSEWVEAQL
jgi:predicted nucleotidyltransferase